MVSWLLGARAGSLLAEGEAEDESEAESAAGDSSARRFNTTVWNGEVRMVGPLCCASIRAAASATAYDLAGTLSRGYPLELEIAA